MIDYIDKNVNRYDIKLMNINWLLIIYTYKEKLLYKK